MVYLLKMVIFNSYVKLPEGTHFPWLRISAKHCHSIPPTWPRLIDGSLINHYGCHFWSQPAKEMENTAMENPPFIDGFPTNMFISRWFSSIFPKVFLLKYPCFQGPFPRQGPRALDRAALAALRSTGPGRCAAAAGTGGAEAGRGVQMAGGRWRRDEDIIKQMVLNIWWY